jgi:hypothetical protein
MGCRGASVDDDCMNSSVLLAPNAPAAPIAPATLDTAAAGNVITDRRQRPDLSKTPASRNRAIDAYRALAMCCVALGHWLAADVRVVDGALQGGNALDKVPSLHFVTWLFQVMPVFFLIGGYANAASLDAHHRAGRPNGEWIRARLARLSAPSAWLAGTWLTVLVVGQLAGVAKIAGMAAGGAAIPLWFLANYVADTALSPITLRLYREHGIKFVGALIALFAVGESARFLDIHYVPLINIILGWLLFQVMGFAWKDGHLPKGKKLVMVGAAGYAIAGALVAFGPWPLAMVSVPGAQFANTWPPSLALMFFGVGVCSMAAAAAPAINRFLTRSTRSWKMVAVANTMTMTSYLWHFTALAVAAFGFSKVNLLPTAAVGTGAWWLQKLPLMGAALLVLLGIIAVLSSKERNGLLGGTTSGTRTGVPESKALTIGTGVAAFALAAGFETWTAAAGKAQFVIPGTIAVLAVHAWLTSTAKRQAS